MALNLPRLRINRTWSMLLIAILLGLGATFLTSQYLQTREQRIAADLQAKAKGGPTVAVVVPIKDLPKGAAITGDVVAAREIPADLVYEGTYTPNDFSRIENQRVLRDVQRGRPLRVDDVAERLTDFSTLLPEGIRAVTLDVDELNSISQLVKPGNRVDLYLVYTDPQSAEQQAMLFMEKIKVLATGQAVRKEATELPATAAPGQPGFRYTNITFAVTPEEAARLALGQQLGKYRYVLRKQDDEGENRPVKVTQRQVLAGGMEKTIEYIIGGRGGGGTSPSISIPLPGGPGLNLNLSGPATAPTAAGLATPPAAPAGAPAQSPYFMGTPPAAPGPTR